MIQKTNPFAGKVVPGSMLVDIGKLIEAYYTEIPDPAIAHQRVVFGTSGHRGSSLEKSFNEQHILAITQAICLYRKQQEITGPLFLGIDTHALSGPAFKSALEVLAANGVQTMIAGKDEYTPTPVISHAILTYNRGRTHSLADGIVITPSHNPPQDGGIKYNPSNGGPADTAVTRWIENKANEFLVNKLEAIQRITFEKALHAASTHRHDYVNQYVNDLENVINMDLIHDSKIKMGVDPMGGAGIHYWELIAQRYKIDLEVVNKTIDPAFGFMSVDWDGKVRMDPSSPYAMTTLLKLKDRFDIAFACDTDHDRHGIITRNSGLIPSNHYLCVMIFYLFQHRPQWKKSVAVGKTLVSSQMIDRICQKLDRSIYEVPVGFKWFVEGLLDGKLGFVGEESAGAAFLRINGEVWTTDKDGIIPALLAAEMTARMERDPGEIYQSLEKEFGHSFYERIDAPATAAQKKLLTGLSPQQVHYTELGGEKIQQIITSAPGNDASIGGIKVTAKNGWFAARPSGTEDIYKIYAESFKSRKHLHSIQIEAQKIVADVLSGIKETT